MKKTYKNTHTKTNNPLENLCRLRDNWGVVDVDDCSNAAKHLAETGVVDPKRLCIDGGSAGGYTTLAALAFR